jgi:hypothetical protein
MSALAIILALTFTSPVARADGFELGLGLRDTHAQTGHLEGLRAAGRWVNQGWALELGLYATPFAYEPSELAEFVLSIGAMSGAESELRYGENHDRATAELRFDLGARCLDRELRFQGGPHLYLGLEGRLLERYTLAYDPQQGVDLGTPVTTLAVGPTVGVGLDAWYAGRVGLRLVVQDRTWWGTEDTFRTDDVYTSRHLHHDPTTTLDLLVGF